MLSRRWARLFLEILLGSIFTWWELNYTLLFSLDSTVNTHLNLLCFPMLLNRGSLGLRTLGGWPQSVWCHLQVSVTWPCACFVNDNSELMTSRRLRRLLHLHVHAQWIGSPGAGLIPFCRLHLEGVASDLQESSVPSNSRGNDYGNNAAIVSRGLKLSFHNEIQKQEIKNLTVAQ